MAGLARILVLAALVMTVAAPALAAERVVLLAGQHDQPSGGDPEPWLAARAQLSEVGVRVDVVQATLGSLSANVELARRTAQTAPALAVIWLARERATVLVFFYDGAASRLYSRRLAAGEAPAATAEEIAIVLRSAVSAVLEGADVAMAEVRLPEPPPATPRARKPPPSEPTATPGTDFGSVRAGVAYVGTLYALDTRWQNGAELSLAVRFPGSGWYAGAAYTYFPALTIAELGAETELRRHPAELFAGFELDVGPFWFLAEGAVIADVVGRSTIRVSDDLAATSDARRWSWAVSSRLGGAATLTRRVRFFFTLGAEFLLSRFDHVVATGTSTESLASPMPARPRAEAGLAVGFW